MYRHLVFIGILGLFVKGCSSQGSPDWDFLFENGKIAIILLLAPFYLTRIVPPKTKMKPLIRVNKKAQALPKIHVDFDLES